MSRPDAIDLGPLEASTQSLRRTIAALRDDQVGEPSLLPGWTRGHVLNHIARNAEGMLNLVAWARTGVPTPMYESRAARDAAVEAGAHRSAAALRADVEETAERLAAGFAELDDEQWDAVVGIGKDNRPVPMWDVPSHRRQEVEIHHVDLDLDYTLAHLPMDFVLDQLRRVAEDLSKQGGIPGFVLVGNDNEGFWTVGAGGQEITGTPPSLLGWALGRTDGIGVFSADVLPALGPWR